jgi:hypothetical protein
MFLLFRQNICLLRIPLACESLHLLADTDALHLGSSYKVMQYVTSSYLFSILLSGDTGPIDTITYVQYPYSILQTAEAFEFFYRLGRWPLPPVSSTRYYHTVAEPTHL